MEALEDHLEDVLFYRTVLQDMDYFIPPQPQIAQKMAIYLCSMMENVLVEFEGRTLQNR